MNDEFTKLIVYMMGGGVACGALALSSVAIFNITNELICMLMGGGFTSIGMIAGGMFYIKRVM